MEYVADSNYLYPFIELQHVVYPSLYFSFLSQDDERTLEEEERMASDEGAGTIDEVSCFICIFYASTSSQGRSLCSCGLCRILGEHVYLCVLSEN